MFDKEDYEYLLSDLQDYGKIRWEQVKLTILDKLARIVGLLLLGLAVIMLLMAVLAVGSVALISVLSDCMPVWAASLIVAAIWILILVAVVSCRKQLFINPMLTAVAAILFSNQPKRKISADSMVQQSEMLNYKAGEQEKNIQREVDRIQRSWIDLFERVATVRNLLGNVIGRIFRR